MHLDICSSLRGQRIFITGATGFLGRVLVEKLLWSVPEIGKLRLLIRSGGRTAGERLREDVLGAPIMARLRALHGPDWEAWVDRRVEVVDGDLERDRLGLDAAAYARLSAGIDRIVNCAATVRFDERLDHALELNTRGALRVLDLARDAGEVPLVHVSTCFVSGRRSGSIPERLDRLESKWVDPDAILEQIEHACQRVRPSLDDGLDSEDPFVAAGRELAARHDFHDVYTLTKALAERLLDRYRYSVPLSIVRPAIVESAASEPIAGWIDAVRVTDPLLVAYGSGRTRELPGDTSAPIDLIPVDHVVNVLIAALADRPAKADTRVYQVGSSRNPISLGELVTFAREGFGRTPLHDAGGRAITVPRARFVEPARFRRKLVGRRARLRWLATGLERLRQRRRGLDLRAGARMLDHFVRLVDVYRPYLEHGARYRDDATRHLWKRLSPAARVDFPFDVDTIDWRSYVADVHVPGLVRFALRAESGAPSRASRSRPQDRAAVESRVEAATNLFDLFAATAAAESGSMALQTFRDGRWLRYTYRQALTTVGNLARTLATRYGIGPGDRVALWSSGRPEWVLATFAVHRLGAVTVPLDPQWPAAEVEEAALHVGARLICAAPELAAGLEGSTVAVVELAAPFVPAPDVGPLPGVELQAPRPRPEDLATIVFTSGTTVAPKAVPLTHGNLLANLRDLVPLMRLSRERMLSVLPIHHVFELMVGLLVPLAGGSTISYVSEIKPAEISWMMGVTRPTVLVAVPRLLELLHNGVRRSVAAGGAALAALFRVLFALSRLTGGRYGHRLFGKVHRRFGGSLRRIVTGGSALEPSLGESFRLMGFEVAEGYGMTETSPVLTVNPWGAIRLGSAGKPLPGVELEIRPIDSAAPDSRQAGGAGAVWVRGANVMSGYLDNPDATGQILHDGWLDTGDIGYLDADGYLHLSGRTKDVIVTAAGKNVHPEEVELRYRALPDVEELVVVGLPAEGGGERVTAVVVPRAGACDEDVARIQDQIAARADVVPTYQRISAVRIWSGDLPKTTTLKVRRSRLRAAILAGEDRAATVTTAAAPTTAEEPRLDRAQRWIVATLARLARARADTLRPETRLADLGVDSLTRVELVGELEAHFDLRLDDTTAASLDRVQDLFDVGSAPAGPAAERPMRSIHA